MTPRVDTSPFEWGGKDNPLRPERLQGCRKRETGDGLRIDGAGNVIMTADCPHRLAFR
jgi:hypothetical protein